MEWVIFIIFIRDRREIEKVTKHLALITIEDKVGSSNKSNSNESSASVNEVTSIKKCYSTIISLNRSLEKLKNRIQALESDLGL